MQCLRTRSPEEVSWQDLCTRSLYEISVAAVYKSSLGKISARDLMARSQQISAQCLCTRSWSEVSWQDLCTRPPRLSKFAPRHKERDPTCPKWREGYVSTCQIFTKHCAHHEIWTLKMSKTMLYLGLSHFFVEVCKVLSTAPAWPFRFWRKSRTKWCPRRSLFRRSRFTTFCVAGVALSGQFDV